jgi:hypothetical protein
MGFHQSKLIKYEIKDNHIIIDGYNIPLDDSGLPTILYESTDRYISNDDFIKKTDLNIKIIQVRELLKKK